MLYPELTGLDDTETPALLFIVERIEANIQLMIQMVAGDPSRLRPHVKTHKTPEIIALQVSQGITRFKAATLAEAELCAREGATDVLVAYPLQRPAIHRLFSLRAIFPNTKFSMLVDNEDVLPIIEAIQMSATSNGSLDVFVDVDCGMGRTGIGSGEEAVQLYRKLHHSPSVNVRGLHAYDGHLSHEDLSIRSEMCKKAFAPVLLLRQRLEDANLPVPTLVAGGSPTFGIHALEPDRECSPGTTLLWDTGSGDKFPDLRFQCAAFLLTRVVSKPAKNRICLDLGHKSVAPEMPQPRVRFQDLEDAPVLMQSEEHLVLEVDQPERFALGSLVLGVPRHVCPSVSMHNQAIPCRNGVPGAPWKISARGRQYTP
jgi:D-serine deaminase-like pyridoxal phosphate-dependent protein